MSGSADGSTSTRPVLCIRHQPSAPLGVGEAVFKERGVPVTYLDVWLTEEMPDLNEFSGLVVLGGEMHAHKMDEYTFLRVVRDLARRAVDDEVPVFGICLGGQILAAAMGAEVGSSTEKEIAYHRLTHTEAGRTDEVLSGFASGDPVFQFHEDTFDLPHGAELLFSTPKVRHQAFRIGERAFGVQFHPEVTRKEIVVWSELAGDDKFLEAEWGVTIPELLAQADCYLEAGQRAGREAFSRFLDLVERVERA